MMNSPEKHTVTPSLNVAASPHVFHDGMTVYTMMRDAIVALIPVMLAALYCFGWLAVKQICICVVACFASEALFTVMRGRRLYFMDWSAIVSGILLGLSLPANASWYIGCIASLVAMGIGKAVFGGLGKNIFNPAMVGRAFVMIAFAGELAASGYVSTIPGLDAISQATPLSAYKQSGVVAPLWALFWGSTNGSIGETSAIACLLGGLFLCFRKVAAWEIPAAILITVSVLAGGANLMHPHNDWMVFHHLLAGALLFGTFFIATDPVTSPLTAKGKWIFGIGIGVLVMIIRWFSGYPEGIMFAVLLMNGVTPLINRWTIPRPFGGI